MEQDFSLNDQIKLSSQDKRDYSYIQNVNSDTIRFRCALIQLLNRRMSRVMNWLDFDRGRDKWSLGHRLQKTSHLFFGVLKKDIFWEGIEKTWGEGLGTGPGKTIIRLDQEKHGEAFASLSPQAPERSTNFLVQYYKSAIGQKKTPKELRSKLFVGSSQTSNGHGTLWTVKYAQGDGMDYGGLYRDSLNKVASCMWHDSFSLFKRVPNAGDKHGLNQETFMPNSTYGKSSKDLFIFVGQILGLSIRTKGYFDVRFPPCFYKLLSGAPLNLYDLATIDEREYYDNSVDNKISVTTQRRNISKENFDARDDDYYFVVTNIAGKKIELIPGGNRIKVTWDTLTEVSFYSSNYFF